MHWCCGRVGMHRCIGDHRCGIFNSLIISTAHTARLVGRNGTATDMGSPCAWTMSGSSRLS
eukprot:48317-Eustigmatos_ZCMA.PRE.1